ncbi:MAG: NfeD family protein [Gammaproteobacteria bacterium]|jgi:membrane protein implicated in regulation of membrane protease activity
MDLNSEYLWLGLGFALIIAEVTMGNFILFFIGLAAVITGIALWLGMPAGNGIPFMAFAGLALVLLVGVRSRLKFHLVGESVQGSADEDYLGKEVTVVSGFDDVSPERGRVHYRGADWNARSLEGALAQGALVKIVGRDGNTLIVEQENN